jgi:hypothetical protein
LISENFDKYRGWLPLTNQKEQEQKMGTSFSNFYLDEAWLFV